MWYGAKVLLCWHSAHLIEEVGRAPISFKRLRFGRQLRWQLQRNSTRNETRAPYLTACRLQCTGV